MVIYWYSTTWTSISVHKKGLWRLREESRQVSSPILPCPVEPTHILERKTGIMGVAGKNASREHITKARTLFASQMSNMEPHKTFLRVTLASSCSSCHTLCYPQKRMPTSQLGFSACLVPNREDILGGNVEKQLCRIVHDKNTTTYLLLVHQRCTWVLGEELETDLFSHLATIYQANTYFVAKLSSFVTVLTKNTTMQDCTW